MEKSVTVNKIIQETLGGPFYWDYDDLRKDLIKINEIYEKNKDKYISIYISQSSSSPVYYIIGKRDINVHEALAKELQELENWSKAIKQQTDHEQYLINGLNKTQQRVNELTEKLKEIK